MKMTRVVSDRPRKCRSVRERREIEKQPINENPRALGPAKPDIKLSRKQGKKEDGHAAGNIMPMERPTHPEQPQHKKTSRHQRKAPADILAR